jgi:hypothetical protein
MKDQDRSKEELISELAEQELALFKRFAEASG